MLIYERSAIFRWYCFTSKSDSLARRRMYLEWYHWYGSRCSSWWVPVIFLKFHRKPNHWQWIDRTKGRPLPSGRITVPQALNFLSVHVILLFTISHFLNQSSWVWYNISCHFITFLQMEPGISYDCAFDRVISFYETYHLFSSSVVRYEVPRYSGYFLPAILIGITLNTPVLIASAVFVNKVSWAAIILATGGLAYVNSSCFWNNFIDFWPLYLAGLCGTVCQYIYIYIALRILKILFRYHIRMPRQERRCKGRGKIHHPYPSKPC